MIGVGVILVLAGFGASHRATASVSAQSARSAVVDEVWLGAQSRFVALHPEQQRTGLEGAQLFFGLAGGVRRGRWSADLGLAEGAAHQRLRIDGVADPRLRIWAFAGGVQVRPALQWPITATARAGLWHFDYRDEVVVLDFAGNEPIEVSFNDFTQPAIEGAGGLELAPLPWMRLTFQAGMLGLRLNEARIDGQTVTVTSRWRASPTAMVGLAFRSGTTPSLDVDDVTRVSQ
jgi:hypothetical protein